MFNIFEIKNLYATAYDKPILKGINMTVKGGEVHAIMGQNGTGKSTLALSIMGHPKYKATSGEALLNGVNILSLTTDERAKQGLFLAMQYPSEVQGVTNSGFIKAAVNATRENKIATIEFIKQLDQTVAELKIRKDLPYRHLNLGFSGGEKKRNEILQMLMLKPKVAILDEIDSGLDIDALKVVANAINKARDWGCAIIIITHYQRILQYLNPTAVHIIGDGKIKVSGNNNLIKQIEKYGYDNILNKQVKP